MISPKFEDLAESDLAILKPDDAPLPCLDRKTGTEGVALAGLAKSTARAAAAGQEPAPLVIGKEGATEGRPGGAAAHPGLDDLPPDAGAPRAAQDAFVFTSLVHADRDQVIGAPCPVDFLTPCAPDVGAGLTAPSATDRAGALAGAGAGAEAGADGTILTGGVTLQKLASGEAFNFGDF